METLRVRWAWPLGLLVVLALPQCKASEGDDDDDAGASGQGATSGTGGAGNDGGSASAGRAASMGGTSSGGAGATGSSGAGGGAGMATGGTAGSHAAGMTSVAGSTAQAGGTNASCVSAVVVAYPQAAPIDQATFDAMFPTAVCNVMKPCCAVMGPTYDETACKTFAATYYDKTLSYDQLAAARCLQSLSLMSPVCDDDLAARGLPDACNIAYRGSVALGAECDRNADCAPDPRAPVECTYTDSVAMDVCTVMLHGKVGDACDEGCELESDTARSCYPNDVPRKLGEWVTCHQEDGVRCTTENVCEASVGLGCDCHFSDDYCDGHHRCGDDSPTCVPRGGMGAACKFNDDCQVEFYCPSEGEETCQPRKHAQEACTSNDECLGLFCQHGSCNIENRDAVYSFNDAFCDGLGT